MTTRRRELDRVDLLTRPQDTAKPYVKKFLTDHGYILQPDGSVKNEKRYVVPLSEVATKLRIVHHADRCVLKLRNEKDGIKTMPEMFKNELLLDCLDEILTEERNDALLRAVDATRFTEALGDAEVRAFVLYLTGKEDPLIVQVLKHWLSNIKRRMLGLPVKYHMFPILVGKQGGGKSTALSMLLKPIEPYVMHMTSVLALADERNFKSLSEKYVTVLDEMARADKTDAQVLKNLITSERLSARILGTNRRDQLVSNCSYIGTANMSVDTLIYDPSGMRRFVEFLCSDVLDWKGLGEIDYTRLWRSIDPKAEHLASVTKQLAQHQETIREPSQVELFIDETGLAVGDRDREADQISCNRIYEMYRGWAERSGRRNMLDLRMLCKHLKGLGYKPWRTMRARGYYVLLSDTIVAADATFAEAGLASLDEIDGINRKGKKRGN